MEEIEIELYETVAGKRPFELWIKEIKEIHTRAKIPTRLDRLKVWKLWRLQNLTRWCLRKIYLGVPKDNIFMKAKLVA